MIENGSMSNLINECINCIELTTPKIETIKLIGLEEAKRGIEKVREADQLLINMNYLKRILPGLQGNLNFDDPIISGSMVDLRDQLFNFYEDIGNIF